MYLRSFRNRSTSHVLRLNFTVMSQTPEIAGSPSARQQRDLAWYVLKMWWAAQRRLRAAQQRHHGSDRQEAVNTALRDIQGLKHHYWPTLQPALEQWERKEAYVKICLVIEQTRRMSGAEREALWHDMVINPANGAAIIPEH